MEKVKITRKECIKMNKFNIDDMQLFKVAKIEGRGVAYKVFYENNETNFILFSEKVYTNSDIDKAQLLNHMMAISENELNDESGYYFNILCNMFPHDRYNEISRAVEKTINNFNFNK